MPSVNNGPATAQTQNTQASMGSSGPLGTIYTYATLPSAASVYPGTFAYTSDVGPVYSNGTSWNVFSGGGGGSPPIYTPEELTSGQHDDVALPGAADYILAYDASDGDADITGFVSAADGQTIIILNTGTDLIQLISLSGDSSAGNQLLIPTDMAIVTNQNVVLRYSLGAGKWLPV